MAMAFSSPAGFRISVRGQWHSEASLLRPVSSIHQMKKISKSHCATSSMEPGSSQTSAPEKAPESIPSRIPASPPSKPNTPALKKGQIVRVDKEKYLNSVEYLAVGHPPYFKGLDYIYEDRGEILDLQKFETGEYALIGWAGIPTSPAWLPTYMLIKSDKLSYRRT